MYLPPLTAHPECEVVAVCGRRLAPAEDLAKTWGVPAFFADPEEMFATADLDAVVIATANNSHHPLAMDALRRGIHVLCEKPLATTLADAGEMAAVAADRGLITMVPFTYHWMPVNQWLRRLLDDGYVGRVHHINARYYTGFALDREYAWRFDQEIAGSGIIGDLGAHWIHLARWLLDDTEVAISTLAPTTVVRDLRPDGSDYQRLEDSAVMTVQYASGAYGVLHTSAVAWEGDGFGQIHQLEIHGSEGTLHATCDWDTVQEVHGMKRGEPQRELLPIPNDIWNGVRQDTVHNTYRDVFRTTDVMTREWISAIAAGRQVQPDFAEGLAVQRVIEAALASAAQNGMAIDPHGPAGQAPQ